MSLPSLNKVIIIIIIIIIIISGEVNCISQIQSL